METFAFYGWILCVSEGFHFQLLCIHIMETFDLHGWVLCVSEGFHFQMLCIDIEGMGISTLVHYVHCTQRTRILQVTRAR